MECARDMNQRVLLLRIHLVNQVYPCWRALYVRHHIDEAPSSATATELEFGVRVLPGGRLPAHMFTGAQTAGPVGAEMD